MSAADTKLQIINAALTHLGKPPAGALTDPTENARTMTAIYPVVVRAELRKHAWSFAMRRASLAADVDTPSFDYARQFRTPGDFMRLVVAGDLWIDTSIREAAQEDLPIFTIEGQYILTNLDAPLRIRYVRDVTEQPEIFDAAFVEALSFMLAYRAAPSLMKNEARTKTIREDYRQALFDAKRTNAIELPPREREDGSWITSRVW